MIQLSRKTIPVKIQRPMTPVYGVYKTSQRETGEIDDIPLQYFFNLDEAREYRSKLWNEELGNYSYFVEQFMVK